jgi:hypothetical protein
VSHCDYTRKNVFQKEFVNLALLRSYAYKKMMHNGIFVSVALKGVNNSARTLAAAR